MINPAEYTVLLVDDDSEKVTDDAIVLRKFGYNIFTANSGEETLDMLRTTHIDILVIDYYMNGITGSDTIYEIRKFNSEIIIILQTGFCDEQPALKMLEQLKIQGYYDKSESREKLLMWVLAASRTCSQIRETINLSKQVKFAHLTLQKMKEDQTRVIEQLRMASIGEKMGSIFHDISNPLLAIQSSIQLIQSQLGDLANTLNLHEVPEPKILESMDSINKSFISCEKRIAYIIKMRDIVISQSKPSSNVNDIEKFLVKDTLESVRFFAEDDIKKYGCTIVVTNNLDPSTMLYGKEVSLIQALGNLITNSAQAYTKKGGIIELTANQCKKNVEFIVKDSAGGIASEVRDKLFKEMITTKDTNGNGVGIYVSYLAIVNYFGGKMWFDSEEGKETSFYISIPLKKPSSKRTSKKSETPSSKKQASVI